METNKGDDAAIVMRCRLCGREIKDNEPRHYTPDGVRCPGCREFEKKRLGMKDEQDV